MRIGATGFVSACFLLLVASAPDAHAGLFGYSELGIIKKNENTFLFVAPDGETVDEASLRFAIGRTAKLLGFSHFIFEPVFDKSAPKAKSQKSDTNADSASVVEEQRPVTRVMVYLYNSPRTRNGVKSIPLSDIDPDQVEPVPVVEEEKVIPKKKSEAPPRQVTPVVEPAPVVAAETPAPKKKKKEVAPQEVTPVAEPAPVVAVETPAPKKKKKEVAPQEVTPVAEPAPVVVVETPAPQKAKPRARRYLLPGDVEQSPEGRARMQDLGDLFN